MVDMAQEGTLIGYLLLVGSAFAYAVGLVSQSIAARRIRLSNKVDINLPVRLATDRLYALGFAAQFVGFLLAYFARGTLPVFLVQAVACTAVGLAAIIGAAVLGWRVTRAELVVLAVMTVALILLAGAAEPSRVTDVPPVTGWLLVTGLLACVLLAIPAWAAAGAVPLAALAGASFAVLAVASRPLPSTEWTSLPLNPLAWVTLAAAAIGQVFLAAALQRGSTTAAGATMDAVTMLVASVTGILLLGDRIADGRTSWVVTGMVLIVASVLAMVRVGVVVDQESPAAADLAAVPGER